MQDFVYRTPLGVGNASLQTGQRSGKLIAKGG